MTELLMSAMKAEIVKHGIKLLDGCWANDFLVHDKAFLERNAKPGCKFAWVIGDNHSHMQMLGIHEIDNDMITAYLRMSSSDKFYEITVKSHDFSVKELNRDSFEALKYTAIPYSLKGSPQSGTLFNGNREVGRIAVSREGPYQEVVYVIKTQPEKFASDKDRIALGLWSERCAIKMAGSLFIRTKYECSEGYEAHQVKAA